MYQFIDLRDEYNAHLRRRRTLRAWARLAVTLAVAVLAVAMGCLIGAANDALVAILASFIVTAGVIGGGYLLTRH